MFWLAQEHRQRVALWKTGRPLEEEGDGTCSVLLVVAHHKWASHLRWEMITVVNK